MKYTPILHGTDYVSLSCIPVNAGVSCMHWLYDESDDDLNKLLSCMMQSK